MARGRVSKPAEKQLDRDKKDPNESADSWRPAASLQTQAAVNGIKLCPTAIWNKCRVTKVWSVYYCTLPEALMLTACLADSLALHLQNDLMPWKLHLMYSRGGLGWRRATETEREGNMKALSSEPGYLLSDTSFQAHTFIHPSVSSWTSTLSSPFYLIM